MNICRMGLVAVAVLAVVGCGNKETEDKPAPTAPAPPAPPPAASTAAVVKPEGPPKLAIEPRVRTELDNRADGLTGTAVSPAGAKASLQAPTTWPAAKGDVTVAAPADKKAQLAASALGAGETAQTKLPAATAALGLASCEWGAPEALTVGKTKLASSGADGVCTKGTTQVRAAWVAPAAEGLLVVGAWDADGDSASVFGAMRSIAKAAAGGDSTGIAACCAALRGNAKVAPPDQQPALLFAAAACDGLRASPDARAALGQVRAALRGANVPSSCQ